MGISGEHHIPKENPPMETARRVACAEFVEEFVDVEVMVVIEVSSGSKGSAVSGFARAGDGPSDAGDFAMSEDSLFWTEADAHDLWRLVSELAAVLEFGFFLHSAFIPIWADDQDASRRRSILRQSNLRGNQEQEARSSSMKWAEELGL